MYYNTYVYIYYNTYIHIYIYIYTHIIYTYMIRTSTPFLLQHIFDWAWLVGNGQ